MANVKVLPVPSGVLPLQDPLAQSPGTERPVACFICGDPVAAESFVPVATHPGLLYATCGNCGLRITVASTSWAAWNRSREPVGERELAEVMRTRRVSSATRTLLDQLHGERGHSVTTEEARYPAPEGLHLISNGDLEPQGSPQPIENQI
jgi:hypothetical protein